LGNAGPWVYKGGFFVVGLGIFYTFMDMMVNMIPSSVPAPISFILTLPPLVGLGWVMVDKVILSDLGGGGS
ncbi:hypothetical protein MUP01_12660, partial [Candidatus Bathyarchaeota archaeon]|nr:hypothetical protein [Candidatus Bathyarchaeota archaeon]